MSQLKTETEEIENEAKQQKNKNIIPRFFCFYSF